MRFNKQYDSSLIFETRNCRQTAVFLASILHIPSNFSVVGNWMIPQYRKHSQFRWLHARLHEHDDRRRNLDWKRVLQILAFVSQIMQDTTNYVRLTMHCGGLTKYHKKVQTGCIGDPISSNCSQVYGRCQITAITKSQIDYVPGASKFSHLPYKVNHAVLPPCSK